LTPSVINETVLCALASRPCAMRLTFVALKDFNTPTNSAAGLA
jgi:hypothetical protein